MKYKIQIQIENFDAERLIKNNKFVIAMNKNTGETYSDLAKASPNFRLRALSSSEFEFYTLILVDRAVVKTLLKGQI